MQVLPVIIPLHDSANPAVTIILQGDVAVVVDPVDDLLRAVVSGALMHRHGTRAGAD